MPELNDWTQWIEGHPTSVDVLKWLVLLAIAWASGLFRFLRDLTRSPRLAISEAISRCLVITEPHEGHADATKAVFLLNIEVANRSSERIVVSSFDLRYKRRLSVNRWSPKTSAVSLPNRVHHKMGGGTKIMRNWFAHFSDNLESLTVEGKIDPRDADSGYALFVSHTYGSWIPDIQNDKVRVQVYASLATGKTVTAKAWIPVTWNTQLFEEMVPGIIEHVGHPSAWNVPARF